MTIPRDGLFRRDIGFDWFYYRKDGWWYEWNDFNHGWVEHPKMMSGDRYIPATRLEFLLITGIPFEIPGE